MKYEVEITESAEKALEKIPKRDRLKLMDRIDSLAEDPHAHGSIKLQGHHKPALYRLRAGDYRVVYTVKHDALIVLVIEIGHRREIYR